jgi:integrase
VLKYLIPPDAKHRTYRGRYKVGDNPKLHEVTLHTTVKEVADKLLREIHEDAQRESVELIPAAFTRKAKRRPLAELFEEYLDGLQKNGRSADHVRIVKLRFLALAKGCRWSCMADVTTRKFIEWRDVQTDYQARTLNNYYEAARAFFNWVDRNYEIPNPLKRVENLDVPVRYPQGPRAFSADELRKLFDIAKPQRRFFYRLMAFTGLRRQEAKRLCWGDIHLEENPGLFLRSEATKARRADWLPILTALATELRAARPENWQANMLVFRRGVADPDTLRRDMTKVGIPLKDSLGRPVGIHTFRRTFISQLQKHGVHSRVIMQLARHKSLRLTDWTYTDTTKLPLAEGIESLAAMAAPATPCGSPLGIDQTAGSMPAKAAQISPRSSPLKSGQNRVLVSKSVQVEKSGSAVVASEVVETEEDCPALAHAVHCIQTSDKCPGWGSNPQFLRRQILSLLRLPIPPPGLASVRENWKTPPSMST